MGNKKITANIIVNISITENQFKLLKLVDEDEMGFEPDNLNEVENDLNKLCELQLVETVLGEQFYITNLGDQFLSKVK